MSWVDEMPLNGKDRIQLAWHLVNHPGRANEAAGTMTHPLAGYGTTEELTAELDRAKERIRQAARDQGMGELT